MIFTNSTKSVPAVRDRERQRVWILRPLMHEMDVEPIDRGFELRQLIEPALLRSPVKRVSPVRHQGLVIREVRPVLPARTGDLVWKTRARQPPLQIGQYCFGHLNLRECRITFRSVERHQNPLGVRVPPMPTVNM